VPKHIADSSPITTPADCPDRADAAGRRDNVRRAPVDDAGATPADATPADATGGVAIGPPTARTVVIRPLLVPH
jgi:hypothetical protein